MTSKERVAAIRQTCPGYDQPIDSKCAHPERYGIRRTQKAESLLKPRTRPVSGARSKPIKHTFWLSKRQEGLMHKARKALGSEIGNATVQFTVEAALGALFEKLEIDAEK